MNLIMNNEVKKMIDDGALFVLNHSGGKDSQCMMIEVLKLIPANQLLVIHADLGEVEWEGAKEIAQKQAANAGVDFLVAKAFWKDGSEKTFFNMVEKRFQDKPESPSWPSGDCRYCTSDLKRDPITREIRQYAKAKGIKLIVSCEGIRAAEGTERKKKNPWEFSTSNSVAGRTWFKWMPIFKYSTEEVFSTIKAAGQQPHWAYAKNDRLSCVFCIYGKDQDLIHGAQQRPELLAKYIALEEKTGYTMHMSQEPLADLVKQAMKLAA